MRQSMNDCVSFRSDLDACRDQTLDEKRQFEVLEHLQDCIPCQQESERAAAIEQELRNQASSWAPTAGLWARIKTSVELETTAGPASARRFYQLRWAGAVFLVLTLGLVSFTLLEKTQQTNSELVAAALVNEFHTFVISHRELDYQDSQPAEVRKWFGDKVNFRVPLPVKTADLQLAGGRLCNMFEQRIASFMYRIDDVWVSLYIMHSQPDRAASTNEELLLQGYGYIAWENQGLHYSLVGDVSIERLRRLAAGLYSTQLPAILSGGRSITIQGSRLQNKLHWLQRKTNA
jgi:anti-sigma factor RsiW